jgi:DNA-binding NarL/FixJ family response regulator
MGAGISVSAVDADHLLCETIKQLIETHLQSAVAAPRPPRIEQSTAGTKSTTILIVTRTDEESDIVRTDRHWPSVALENLINLAMTDPFGSFQTMVTQALGNLFAAGAASGAPPLIESASIDDPRTAPRPDEAAGEGNAPPLSKREFEIIQHLLNGCSNKMIARHLHIAEATVKIHIRHILGKSRCSNRTQAALWAINTLGMKDSR